jgi:phosphatidylserine/phosphatidylglycerophosphate/cardiolipin synthase-like enzyme
MQRACVICFLLFLSSFQCYASKFMADASYQVCFTPAENCTSIIVAAIRQAKKEVLVQAYSFTSVQIIKSLIDASRRGVVVKIILDKSQVRTNGFSSAKLLSDYHIPLWIDYSPSIAHNKVMIIDREIVITGSFNFTKAAEERNAENVIIIFDKELAKKYINNWFRRAEVSSVY